MGQNASDSVRFWQWRTLICVAINNEIDHDTLRSLLARAFDDLKQERDLMVWSGWESVIIYFGLTDLVPLVERAQAAERMFERTMGDFNRDWAYARAHPECPFEGDPIEFYRGLTAELNSAIESADRHVSPMMMTKHAMSDLAPDPPSESMDDRAHEPGALLGREDRDRASDQADEDEVFTRCSLRLRRREKPGAGEEIAQLGDGIGPLRLHAHERQADLREHRIDEGVSVLTFGQEMASVVDLDRGDRIESEDVADHEVDALRHDGVERPAAKVDVGAATGLASSANRTCANAR